MTYVDNFREARERLLSRLTASAEADAELVRAEVVDVLESSTPTGREYKLPDGRTYRASAPGEPPASPTGAYPRSWQASAAAVGDGHVVAEAFSGLKVRGRLVGDELEHGTAGPPPVEPRPHVRPAMERALPKLRAAQRERFGR